MKVFLSWSGALSKSIAKEFKEWLPTISQNIEPFFSEEDIALGKPWSAELKTQLNETFFGIFFFTAENINSDWMQWEAASLSGKPQSKLCVLTFNVSNTKLPEPIKQYQNAEYSKDGIGKLLKSLNSELKEIKEQHFKAILNENWKTIDQKIQTILSRKNEPIKHQAPPIIQVQEVIRDSIDDQKIMKSVHRRHTSFQLLALAIETPAYFLDERFKITYSNLSSALIFDIHIHKARGRQIKAIIEERKNEIINYPEVINHLEEKFSDPNNLPLFDFEKIQYKHRKYGNINLEKIAVAVRDPDNQLRTESWVIAFNITEIDQLDKYYDDLQGAIENYFQFQEENIP